MSDATGRFEIPPGIKFSVRIPAEPADEDLQFLRQLGVDHVYAWVEDHQRDAAFLARLREKVASAGLTLFNVGNFALGKSARIHLALPGRDEDVKAFKQFVRDLARAGIHTTTFTWEPGGGWRTARETTRGGAMAGAVDMTELPSCPAAGGKSYAEEELWANFAHFTAEVVPVLEETGVRLALHPNDPPAPRIAGVPCLIRSFSAYRRAFEIAASPQVGMEFCTGCWLEGGEAFGDIFEAIDHFGRGGRIFIVHFRNVSSTLPHFVETFQDDGYADMYALMRAFVRVGYAGTMTLDHTPAFIPHAGKGAATAYAIGYMRALLQRARAEGQGAPAPFAPEPPPR